MKKFVYMDASAGWLKPQSVIESEADFLRNSYANAGRGICARAGLVDTLIDDARGKVADFIGADKESTDNNISAFETAFNSAVEKVVTSRMGESHKPENDNDDKVLTTEDFDNMSTEDIINYTNKLLNK